MVVVDAVALRVVVLRLHEVDLGSASNMEGVRGVQWKAAPAVQRVKQACASLMEVAAAANTRDVLRVLREAPCSARPMVAGSDASLWVVQKVLREAHRFVRPMVAGSAASMMVVGYVPKVFMEEQVFVLPMGVEKGVLWRAALKVHVAAQITVLGMGEGRGAGLKTVGRAPKVAQISARPMVGGNGVIGATASAQNLRGERAGSVLHTQPWFRSGGQTIEEVCSDQDSSMGYFLLLPLLRAPLTTIILPQASVHSRTLLIPIPLNTQPNSDVLFQLRS